MRTGDERVDAQRKRENEREAAECRHGVEHGDEKNSFSPYSSQSGRGARGGGVRYSAAGVAGFVPMHEAVDAGEEVVGQEGLEAEVGVEAGVFGFGFFETADDKNGDGGSEVAHVADEFGAVHAGHDVVGDDEVDGSGELVVAELLERALGGEDGNDEVPGALEDGLAGGGLDGVVVDEEKRWCHTCGVSDPEKVMQVEAV